MTAAAKKVLKSYFKSNEIYKKGVYHLATAGWYKQSDKLKMP